MNEAEPSASMIEIMSKKSICLMKGHGIVCDLQNS